MAKGTLIITDGEGNIIPFTPPPKAPPPTPAQIYWAKETARQERREYKDGAIDRLISRAKSCLCLTVGESLGNYKCISNEGCWDLVIVE